MKIKMIAAAVVKQQPDEPAMIDNPMRKTTSVSRL
jgi:hypothetical protein